MTTGFSFTLIILQHTYNHKRTNTHTHTITATLTHPSNKRKSVCEKCYHNAMSNWCESSFLKLDLSSILFLQQLNLSTTKQIFNLTRPMTMDCKISFHKCARLYLIKVWHHNALGATFNLLLLLLYLANSRRFIDFFSYITGNMKMVCSKKKSFAQSENLSLEYKIQIIEIKKEQFFHFHF